MVRHTGPRTPRRGFQGNPLAFRERYLEVFQGFYDSKNRFSLAGKVAALKDALELAIAENRSQRYRDFLSGEIAAAEEAAIAIELDGLSDAELFAEIWFLRSHPEANNTRLRVAKWLSAKRRHSSA